MDALLIVGVVALLVIAGATALAPRLGLASPLLLVALGVAISVVPAVPDIAVDPEWILAGVLPPLLYSAAVSMPSVDFRREFTAIGGMSVVLVVASAVVTGLFFTWVIPGISLAWGIALGAVVSPTDAVATSIIKKLGVSPRVVTMLEGEGLLNDATALVLLRTAVAGAAAAVSLPGAVGTFAWAVLTAAIIGFVVGKLNLAVRGHITDATVSTVLSFVIPFVASVPTELVGGSGLVAAVIAGLVTGRGAVRSISPLHRITERGNWRTIELLLEGGIFLLMGLEITSLIHDVMHSGDNLAIALGAAGGGWLVTIAVRAGYVSLIIMGMGRRLRRKERFRPQLTAMHERLADPDTAARVAAQGRRGERHVARFPRISKRIRQMLTDIDFFLAWPLGAREGTIVTWAGMRGAVTVAAAQTLPTDMPHRALIVMTAFIVAAGSLMVQGSTLPLMIRTVRPRMESAAEKRDERVRLDQALSEVPVGTAADGSLAAITARRQALLQLHDTGGFSSAALAEALAVLDADQIRLELRRGEDG